jgi:SAM-dependent methyltransferase
MSHWTEDFFGGLWLEAQRSRFSGAESDLQAEQVCTLLGLEPGMRVLDAPCGDGRIGRRLHDRGMFVTGIDIAEPLLADARAACPEAVWRHQDMRTLDVEGAHEAVLNLWGSIGFFDQAGDQAFLDGAARSLVPGGKLLIEANAVESLSGRWQNLTGMRMGEVWVMEERHFEPLTGVVSSAWTMMKGGVEEERESHIRLYSLPTLHQMLEKAGFAHVGLFGGLDGQEFALGKRMVLVATRQGLGRG